MKAHIYEPKALAGIEIGAGALFLGKPTEKNKIGNVEAGMEVYTTQQNAGMVDGIHSGLKSRRFKVSNPFSRIKRGGRERQGTAAKTQG